MTQHLSASQLRAARGLLDWTRAKLAELSGVSEPTIHRIETGAVQPHEKSVANIIRAFDENGIEFTDDGGVRPRLQNVETLKGREGFTRFYEILRSHISAYGGDICVSGADERLFEKYRDNAEKHRLYMTDLKKRQPDLTMRILVAEGDYNFTASGYAAYRWQPKELFSPTAFYVFGDCLTLISFTNDPPPLIILIKSSAFAEAYRHSFNLMWRSAQKPPSKK